MVARSDKLASGHSPCETEQAACPHLITQIEKIPPQCSTPPPSFDCFSVCVRCSRSHFGPWLFFIRLLLSVKSGAEWRVRAHWTQRPSTLTPHWLLKAFLIVLQTCFCEKYIYAAVLHTVIGFYTWLLCNEDIELFNLDYFLSLCL